MHQKVRVSDPLLPCPSTNPQTEVFLLFSDHIPSHSLGFVDATALSVDVDVDRDTFTVRQSPGLLTSQRGAGTTGAVLWKVTPLVATWLSDPSGFLWKTGILHRQANVVELGCGISGLLGMSLAPLVSQVLLTDQSYVMRRLRENILLNQDIVTRRARRQNDSTMQRPPSEKLQVMQLDWEADSAANIRNALGPDKAVDLLVACDCIYNDFLIEPFVETCRDICVLVRSQDRNVVVLIAQQLRSEAVLEAWLQMTLRVFHVWRLPDHLLSEALQPGSGYVLHLALLRELNEVGQELGEL